MAKTRNDLVSAANDGDLAEVKKCLAAGVDVNAAPRNGDYASWTALHAAASGGQVQMMQYLLTQGARTDILDDEGRSPLAVAQQWRQKEAEPLLARAERMMDVPQWSLFGSSCIAHVEASLPLQKQLTEIFNFFSREKILIAGNLETGLETVLPPVSFDNIPAATIENAFEKFRALGGKADEAFVLHGNKPLDKPRTHL